MSRTTQQGNGQFNGFRKFVKIYHAPVNRSFYKCIQWNSGINELDDNEHVKQTKKLLT